MQLLALIKARAIGVMTMIDSRAVDDKIIAVATNDPEFSTYIEARDLSSHRLLVLKRFFSRLQATGGQASPSGGYSSGSHGHDSHR